MFVLFHKLFSTFSVFTLALLPIEYAQEVENTTNYGGDPFSPSDGDTFTDEVSSNIGNIGDSLVTSDIANYDFDTNVTATFKPYRYRSGGIVLFRKYSQYNILQYLLLQTALRSAKWGFSHGRVLHGESEKYTALRELQKHTGVRQNEIRLLGGFVKNLQYTVNQMGTVKFVVFYLAELLVPEKELKLSQFHVDYQWVSFQQALSITEFTQQHELLYACNEHLERVNAGLRSVVHNELGRVIETQNNNTQE